MLGWEFPPYFAGGVGTVCYELTRGLSRKQVPITYIMPHGPIEAASDHVRLLVADREVQRLGIRSLKVNSLLRPYVNRQEYLWNLHTEAVLASKEGAKLYGEDLLEEVERFASALVPLASHEDFDVIHAHDWTTIPAALSLKRTTGKPVILHVHITEFDKTGGEHADPAIYAVEHEGFHNADVIIAVSNFVKNRLIESYNVPPEKIRVVYNTVEFDKATMGQEREKISKNEKLVLFLGRVTLQKGPDYFLEAAAKVCKVMPDVKFVMAGTGDMLPRMIERAAELQIHNKVIFPGFVSRDQGDLLYRSADLFVMPSVSEPFGIVPLEAMNQGTPVIVSRQSGVSEVLNHALKVDFWNTDDLANKIVAALTYSELHRNLREHGTLEIQGFTWDTPAEHCMRIYEEVCA